jgi:hypothetical protein
MRESPATAGFSFAGGRTTGPAWQRKWQRGAACRLAGRYFGRWNACSTLTPRTRRDGAGRAAAGESRVRDDIRGDGPSAHRRPSSERARRLLPNRAAARRARPAPVRAIHRRGRLRFRREDLDAFIASAALRTRPSRAKSSRGMHRRRTRAPRIRGATPASPVRPRGRSRRREPGPADPPPRQRRSALLLFWVSSEAGRRWRAAVD